MSLPIWFSNQKIYRKLILTNVLSITMALIPLVIVMFGYEYYAVRKAVLQEIRVQAEIVSDSAAAALAFTDSVTASEALATLDATLDVKMATLILPNGDTLASYNRSQSDTSIDDYQDLDLGKERLTFNRFALKKPVFLRSAYVGALVLEASLGSFYQRIMHYFIVISVTTLVALALSLWLAALLRDSITRPLSALLSSVHRVTQKHDFSIRPKVIFPDEIGDLSHAFGEMMNNIQERDERLQDLAFYDKVTDLPNRNFFQERIRQVVSNALRYQTCAALMYIDLDDFKHVNDTFGHDAGDQLLKSVGQLLRESLRNNDLVFRIGGDEFAVILENIEDSKIPIVLAEKAMSATIKPLVVNGQAVKITMSIGISYCPEQANNAADFLKFADRAMYVAKSHAKNTYHVYSLDS